MWLHHERSICHVTCYGLFQSISIKHRYIVSTSKFYQRNNDTIESSNLKWNYKMPILQTFLKNTVFWPSWMYLKFYIQDHTCHQLRNTSRAINLHGGIEKIDPNVSIPETWAENSNRNIQESQGINFNIYALFFKILMSFNF